jgi:rhamnose utilization protein RhaD (predicted bifunctional aldolase and dehydrogenase)
MSRIDELLQLAREIGREERKLVILGEGNISARASRETFFVKASGSSLASLSDGDLTECRFEPLLALLDRVGASDEEIESALKSSQVLPSAKKPSTEAVFHALLLSRPGVEFVAHTHPIAVNGVLCSPRAADFASKRQFPDEIVCCGEESLLLDYVDPGLPLAKLIRQGLSTFSGIQRVILLKNHGLIAPAGSVAGALAATLMCVKAAEIFSLAALHGGPVFLDAGEVDRIENRQDEHHRRRQLGV